MYLVRAIQGDSTDPKLLVKLLPIVFIGTKLRDCAAIFSMYHLTEQDLAKLPQLNSTAVLPLPTDDIMDLLNLCLTSTYFQYNGKHYKQLHGTAMGSPVSVVVAEIVMQNIEEQALATYTRTIPIWLRYVDDTFTAVHKDGIDDFHEHLNRQNADIQFTKEIEENGKIPFLDCLVTRNNNKLQTTVYRKPTHTDRLLDQSSYNPTSHKATTIRTLTR